MAARPATASAGHMQAFAAAAGMREDSVADDDFRFRHFTILYARPAKFMLGSHAHTVAGQTRHFTHIYFDYHAYLAR